MVARISKKYVGLYSTELGNIICKMVKLCHFLKTLILDNCQNLKKIRGVPPNIRTLSARDCPSLNFWCKSVLQNEVQNDSE
jgi:hypothetical protein